MGLFIKVITIEDVKKELYPSTFGAIELYPNGTKRFIKKLTPKKNRVNQKALTSPGPYRI